MVVYKTKFLQVVGNKLSKEGQMKKFFAIIVIVLFFATIFVAIIGFTPAHAGERICVDDHGVPHDCNIIYGNRVYDEYPRYEYDNYRTHERRRWKESRRRQYIEERYEYDSYYEPPRRKKIKLRLHLFF